MSFLIKAAFLGLAFSFGMGYLLMSAAFAGEIDAITRAIYWAEGGPKASVPYGLIYDRYCTEEPGWCGYLAQVTVEKNLKRWQKAGNPGDFIEYLGSRYAPPSAHPLNRNWARNVRKLAAVGAVRG